MFSDSSDTSLFSCMGCPDVHLCNKQTEHKITNCECNIVKYYYMLVCLWVDFLFCSSERANLFKWLLLNSEKLKYPSNDSFKWWHNKIRWYRNSYFSIHWHVCLWMAFLFFMGQKERTFKWFLELRIAWFTEKPKSGPLPWLKLITDSMMFKTSKKNKKTKQTTPCININLFKNLY